MGASALQVFVLKDGQLLRSEVFADGAYAIGRDPDCDLVLDDDEISPIHARLQYKDGVATLVDEGSPTGVIVNGDPIESQVVSSTDDIHLGPFLLKLRRLGGKISAGPVARHEAAESKRPAPPAAAPGRPPPSAPPPARATAAPAGPPRPPPPPPDVPSRPPQTAAARGASAVAAVRSVPPPGPISDPPPQAAVRPIRFATAPGVAKDVVEQTVRDRDLRIVEDEPDELVEVLDDEEAAPSPAASPVRTAEELPKIAPAVRTLETAPVSAEAVKPILAPPPPVVAKAPANKAIIAQIIPIAKVATDEVPAGAVEAPAVVTVAPPAKPVTPPAPAVARVPTPPSPVEAVKPKPAVARAQTPAVPVETFKPKPAAPVAKAEPASEAVKPKPAAPVAKAPAPEVPAEPPTLKPSAAAVSKAPTPTSPVEALKPATGPAEPVTLPGPPPAARESAPPPPRPAPPPAAPAVAPAVVPPASPAAAPPKKSAPAPAKLAAKAGDEERLVVRVWWGKRLVGSRSFAKGQDVVAAPEEGAALPLYAIKGETTLVIAGETGWLIKPPAGAEVSVRSGPRDPWRPPATDFKHGLAFTKAEDAARLNLGQMSVEFSRGRAQDFVRLRPRLDPVFIAILVPLVLGGAFLLRHLPPHTREIPAPPVERFANYIHDMQERAKPPEEKKEIVRTTEKTPPKPIAEAQTVKAATQSLREVEKVAAATRQIDSLLASLNKVAAPIKGVHNSAIAALGNLPNIPTLGNIAGINGIGDLSGPLTKGLAALGGAGSLGSGTAGAGQVRGVPIRVPRKPSKIQGQIDRDALARVINAHVNDMRACYERSLMRDSNLGAGKVTLEWTIDTTGSVSDVSTKTSTIKNNEVVSCLLDVIRGLKFPKPEGGVVIVSYPILFNSVGY